MDKANYQSASILTNLSKIFEEIIHCQTSLLFEDSHQSISLNLENVIVHNHVY